MPEVRVKKLLIAVVVVVVLLVAGYFLAAGIIETQAKSVARSLKAAGQAMSMDDIAPWFEAGSRAAASALESASALADKSDLQRLAFYDTVGWKTDPTGMKQFAAGKGDLFSRLMRISAMGPANFGVDFRAGMNCRLPKVLPSFPGFRMLLSIEARTLADAGQYDSALAVLGASFRLANSLAEPLLIHKLVEVVGLDTAFALTGRFAPHAGSAAVERLATILGQFDPTPKLAPALQSEGVMVREALALAQTFYPFAEESPDAALTTPAIGFLPLREYALLRQLQAQKEQLAIVELPWYEANVRLDRSEQTMGGTGLLAKVARYGVANLRPFYSRMERYTAMRDAALLGLKAVEFRRRAGRVPERLDEFAPDAPVDRFSGQPYLYRVEPAGLLVYGVGSDGNDDGGDARKDVVFRVRL